MLSDFLSAKKNNLDIFRLLAAAAVIFGHAHDITGQQHFDPVRWITIHGDYSGSLAVKFFFFVSGLVVTNSLLRGRSLAVWTASRLLRVIPAYVLTLVLCAVVLPPLFSDQGARIFLTAAPYQYVVANIEALFSIRENVFHIDGVFAGFPHPSLNGSIWTLPFEFRAYFYLGLFFLIGGFRSRHIATVVLASVMASEIVWPNSTHLFTRYAATQSLLPCFVAGALVAIWSDYIPLRGGILAILVLAAIAGTISLPVYRVAYCAVLFYGLLLLSIQPRLVRLKRYIGADISYGTYLYGWPSQMLVFGMIPALPVLVHVVAATVLAMTLGWASWTLIEKRAKFGAPRIADDRAVENAAA